MIDFIVMVEGENVENVREALRCIETPRRSPVKLLIPALSEMASTMSLNNFAWAGMWHQEIVASNRKGFWEYVRSVAVEVDEHLTRFLVTAVNVTKRCRVIFQPRCRAGRWKAKS